MQRNSFSLRRFRVSDVDGIVELFKTVFEGNLTRQWWEWKYSSNPAGFRGEEGDIWVAESHDGPIVGHWAVIPEIMQVGTRIITVGQAVDAATHPDFRGKGIFRNLVNCVLSDVEKRYGFVFGFPNELYRGYEKLGWKSFRMIDFLAFINFDRAFQNFFKNHIRFGFAKITLALLRGKNSLSLNPKFDESTNANSEIEEITIFSKEINQFWKLVKSQYEIIIKRDSSFLNWRFSKHLGDYQKFIAISSENREIVGYAITKKTKIRGIEGILDIVDLQTLPNEDNSFISLMKFIIDRAKADDLNIIHCRVPSWHKHAKFLRRLGFIAMGRTLEYAGLYQPRLIIHSPTQKISFDINKWFYTLADTDYA